MVRRLAPLALLLLARVAVAEPGLVELKAGTTPVVVASSDEPDAGRRVVEGRVTKIKRLADNVIRVTVGRGPAPGSFQVGLPPRFKLPIRAGDPVRAELWFEGGTLHARVTDGRGAPLVFMNELPTGWTLAVGPDTGRPPRGPRRQHQVALTTPDGVATAFEGWVRGPIDGVTYRVYGEAAVIDAKLAREQGLTPTWTQSIWSGVVRER